MSTVNTVQKFKVTLLGPESLANRAPAIYNRERHPHATDRYNVFRTDLAIESMRSRGWFPIRASQVSTQRLSDAAFAAHEVVFVNRLDLSGLSVGDTFPTLTLTNSHNRSTEVETLGSIFRVTCLNGMTIGKSILPGYKIKHDESSIDSLMAQALVAMTEQISILSSVLSDWQSFIVSPSDQLQFAKYAIASLIDNSTSDDRKIDLQRADFSALLQSRRAADGNGKSPRDFLLTLQTVQENLMVGGARLPNYANGRAQSLRPIKAMQAQAYVNKKLFNIANAFRQTFNMSQAEGQAKLSRTLLALPDATE